MNVVDALLGKQPKQPAIPVAEVPAAPAPDAKVDAGAKVVVGTDAKDKRASGNKKAAPKAASSSNVLGNLGKGGLSI